jgi:predicted MFS family arabinose efflux permease
VSSSSPRDCRILFSTRALRGFADGAVSVLLASHLLRLGFSAFEVGAIVTGTMLGSAALTLAVGLAPHPWRRRTVLLAAAALMLLTGIGFAELTDFWPLLLVAIVGTLNPSAGDVSVFLPAEQSSLAQTVPTEHLTASFAWYNLWGALAGALGALMSGLPRRLAEDGVIGAHLADRAGFIVYAAISVGLAVLYGSLTDAVENAQPAGRAPPLSKSRSIVVRLTLLFSLDSFGGGFVVQSLLALWLLRRFAITGEVAGVIFFASGIMSAFSQLASSRLAARFGRINTMVFTHLPSNALLIVAALVPNATLAITFLILRASISQMDVPARQSYVMAVVPPEERAAASSVTNVPRSLAAGISPLIAGWMLDQTVIGWPLIVCGVAKSVYDVLLLIQFRAHKPGDEV